MPTFSKAFALLLALSWLSACGTTPQPEPEIEAAPAPEWTSKTLIETPAAEDTAATESGDGEAEAGVETAVPEPVDLDQIAYEEAIAALKNDETEFALGELTRLSAEAPDKPRLFTNLGLAHFRLQSPEPAEQAFEQAILRDPDDAVAYNHLGILKRRKGEFTDALAAYQKAIEIDVNYARAHLNLGILFDLYLQDLEKALQHYRTYQELTSEENELVAGWIVDIERRLKSSGQG